MDIGMRGALLELVGHPPRSVAPSSTWMITERSDSTPARHPAGSPACRNGLYQLVPSTGTQMVAGMKSSPHAVRASPHLYDHA
ncbi:hypothetical protein [Actinomadura litoris]|uniref:Uncharacterized protein n=1 Tax=Actinomadura litoris TaxID=2678616 RepID=A0A7K1L8A8_9ACTN|nr:hypothetical protein [Actinomadura litoris]MUN40533.1 hypothetical protein [Actinomadura litoris]